MEIAENDILDGFFTMLKEKNVPPFGDIVLKEARKQMRRGFFTKSAYAELEKVAKREYPWTREMWDNCVASVSSQGWANDPKAVCAAQMWEEWGIGPRARRKEKKKGSLNLTAYPNGAMPFEYSEANVPEWQQLCTKIRTLAATMPKYSKEDCVAHYTKDMSVEEKDRFVRWFNYEESGERDKYLNREGSMKTAQMVQPVVPNILGEKKDDLAKRTRNILKQLGDLERAALISKEVYRRLSTLLHEFDVEVHNLVTAQMINDLTIRNIRILNRSGMHKQANLLKEHFSDIPMRTAGVTEDDVKKLTEASEILQTHLNDIRTLKFVKDLNKAAVLLDDADIDTKEVYNAINKLVSTHNAVEESLAETYEITKKVLTNKKLKMSMEHPTSNIPVEPKVVSPKKEEAPQKEEPSKLPEVAPEKKEPSAASATEQLKAL